MKTILTTMALTASMALSGAAFTAYEAELIQRAIKRNGGDKAKAAKELGISRSQLYAKLKATNTSRCDHSCGQGPACIGRVVRERKERPPGRP